MAVAADLDSLPTAQRIGTLVSDSRQSLQQMHLAMEEERAFCWDLEQYWSDTGNTKDRNRIQPRDQSVFRLARFKAAEMMKVPLYFTARGVDSMTDQATAKWARWALQMDTEDPSKRFDRICRQVIWAGLTSRIGCAYVSWNPDAGNYGDMQFDHIDGRDIGWAPEFTDPHHPACPWMYHIARLSPAAVARMTGWKNTEDVTADDGAPGSSGSQSNTDVSGSTSFQWSGRPEIGEMQTQKFITVVMFWERFGAVKVKREARMLAPHERYMVHSHGDNAGRKAAVSYPPDMYTEGMPETDVLDDGTPIKRIDMVLTEEEVRAYPQGKLTIVAPWSGGGRVFYEGDWPQPMRSFPYLVWQPYMNPWRQIGTSDVDLNWTMTLVKNATVRRWYEQLRESRGIMLMPAKGLKDANDEEFRYTDANGFVALYDTAMPPTAVRWVEGPEPSAQLERFISWAENNLRSQEGSSDIATQGDAQSLKGVPVGVMQQAVQSGNTSVNDHVATWQLELGMFLSCCHDIQRARWTAERWVRYIGEQGRALFLAMRGADIPQADIMISSKPTLDAVNGAQLDSVLKLSDLAMKNPKAAEVAARHMDIDPDDLAAILSGAVPPPMPMAGAPPGAPPGMPPAPGGGLPPPMSPAQPGPTPSLMAA